MREIFVANTYANQSVLVTGATGFVGKVLVEKLLRDCPDIKKVYILLRAKKGDSLEKRFESFKNLIIFKNLKKSDPKAMEKIQAINGDFMEKNSGILQSDFDYLCKNLNFIIHCAASVRFDEPLKIAVRMNTISTRNMLYLAEKCENMKAFVHVSTAFSNTNQKEIYEHVYEPICDYNKIISLVEENKDEEVEQICDMALQTFPNTYVFTKNITEKLVSDYKHLPVTIVRPSIVCPSFAEPFVGWVDSVNGPMGVLTGAGAGVIRSIHGNGDLVSDLIPCDFVVNCIIAAGASVASSPTREFKVYNCTSSTLLPITWNEFLDMGREIYPRYPSTKVLWYPGGRMCANYYFYLFYFTLFQFLPACLIDGICILAGKKSWAIKLQRRIFDSLKNFEYFINHSWQWKCKNFQLLFQQINLEERQKFNFDIATLDYNQYIENWISGSRKFILKQDDSTIPEAKRKYMFLFWIDFLTKALFFLGIGYGLYKVYTSSLSGYTTIIDNY